MPKNYDTNGAIRRRDMLRRRYLPDSASTTPQEISPLTRYVIDGVPSRPPLGSTVADNLRFAEGASNRMVMSLYPAPSRPAIEELAEAWDLHPTIVEDLLVGQQRPKLDRYEDITFIAIRSARYIDSREEVDFSEFHILMKPQAIAILCQDNQWIDGTSARRPAQLQPPVARACRRPHKNLACRRRVTVFGTSRCGLSPA